MNPEAAPTDLAWTPHPLLDAGQMPALTREELARLGSKEGGIEAAAQYYARREEIIQAAAADPLRHGFELTHWADTRRLLSSHQELICLGGNGSAKTEFGAKVVAELLTKAMRRRVLCVARNEDVSKANQQAAVFKYLPRDVRARNEGPQRRKVVAKVNYTQAGGFTEKTFVLPNGSQCWFKTVEQYQRDRTSFEGPEYDGLWMDEPVPVELVETLRYRVGKRGGKMLFTFTAIDGYDAVCAQALAGARVVQSLPMDHTWGLKVPVFVPELSMNEEHVAGCPRGHMPYILQPLDPARAVICFWTHWNPFIPIQSLLDKCRGRPKSTVRCRVFGWVEKRTGCQFPAFNPNVHVLGPDKIPQEGTDYMSADPAQARSYFMLWMRTDPLGRKFIFDESPRVEEGEWVTADGQRGDGQTLYAGLGVNWHRNYIRCREAVHGREALRRKGDPRGFATAAAGAEGSTRLMDLFREPGNTKDPLADEPMDFEAAKVRERISLEIEVINNALSWDQNKERNIQNEPQLFISERWQNLIQSMVNWSPEQGPDSPWKDPIDALRYLFDEDLCHIPPEFMKPRKGGGF